MLGFLFRVKFLVMSDKGPVAETDWSNELHLQQGTGSDEQVKWRGLGGSYGWALGMWGDQDSSL
jgi:hypothetical protein